MTARLLCCLLTVTLLVACATPPTDTLRVSDDRLFIPVRVNGVATEALLDSGAEMTLIDAGFAAELGLALVGEETARGTGGTQPVRFAEGVSLEAAEFRAPAAMVAVMDLQDIATRLVGEPVTMVLGREIFDSGRYLIDIEGGRFVPVTRTREPPGVRLPLTEERGIRQLPVVVDDLAPTVADFDLGNGSEVLIGRDYAVATGLLDRHPVIGTRPGGGIGGALDRDLIVLDRLTLAGRSFPSVEAAVDATATATPVNVGVAVLRHFIITVDFPEDTVWLQAR
jgi:hypothetical protein